MPAGFQDGTVPTDATASPPAFLRDTVSPANEYVYVELFAPKSKTGVTGNTEAVWVGIGNVSGATGKEAGFPLHPGDSWLCPKSPCKLNEIWLSVTTTGDKVTWIVF